jgi:2-polyprenyl-6-methoxyphenol hydroxylase-like FAD-dependent oxidoreductase
MTSITVLGGGVAGLSAALLLARDGHDVTVLERDEAGPPDSPLEAWESWSREGVTQFRLAHYLQSRGREVLEQALPDVQEALVSAGAARFDALSLVAAHAEPAKPGDERFVTYTARRPIFEQVLARAAEQQPGVRVRRGCAVEQLELSDRDGCPHVTGAWLQSGETLSADLFVDAMGRRSQLPRWLSDAGVAPLHEEAEDSGFIYYSRFFASRDGTTPEPRAPLLMPLGTFSVLTLPSDNDTWSVTLYVSSGDQQLKRMRDVERWTSVVAACPLQAHWLEGEPVSEIVAMGGIVDRYRRAWRDDAPLVTGIALLGDAWACTNPSLGRGMTLALMHAQCLQETVRSHIEDPLRFAHAWDEATERELTPWYRETVMEDRARLAEIDALRDGREPTAPDDEQAALRSAFIAAMPQDGDLFRAFLDTRSGHRRVGEVFAEPGVVERIHELAPEGTEPGPWPGPGREQLLALLA